MKKNNLVVSSIVALTLSSVAVSGIASAATSNEKTVDNNSKININVDENENTITNVDNVDTDKSDNTNTDVNHETNTDQNENTDQTESGNEETFKSVVTIKIAKGGVAVWDTPYKGHHKTGKYLQNKTGWKTTKRVLIDGKYWYCLGGNQWVDGQYAVLKDDNNDSDNSGTEDGTEEIYKNVVTINVAKGGVAIWDSPYQGKHTTGKYLKKGTAWKTTKRVKIDGKYWYCLGGSQWLDSQYAILGHVGKEETFKDVVTVNVAKGGIAVWNSPYQGQHTTGKYLKKGTSWKTTKRVKVEGKYWYCVGGNQWLDSRYVELKSGSNARVKKAIDTAKAQVGKPYVYGGNNPGVGFDCSGLTQYAYSKAGSNIGRTTINQEHAGSNVSLSSLKPGDLIFWGRAGSSYHVAISIGGNKYIHSPKPGDRVKVDTISSSFRPSFAKRVIK